MGNLKFFTVFLFSFLFSVHGYGQEILLNGGFESGVAKWKSYCDAAGTAPVDGVGGGGAGFTITASTTSPLSGKSSGIITKDAANRQGCGVAADFTLANENKAKVLQIKIPYQVASGTYADDQYKVYVYDVDNAVMIEAAPTFIKNSLLVEQYRGVFQATLSGTNYRLIIHNASTSAVASTLRIEASVSSQLIAVGNYETDWITWTPTFSGMGTVTNSLAQYRIVGDMMQIKISGRTGTVTTADCRFSLPGGFSPDTAKMTSTRTHKYGDVSRIYNSSTPATLLSAFYNSTYPNEVSLSPNSVSGTYTQLGCDSMFTSTDAFASSDIFIPILGRGSNTRLSSEYSQRDVVSQFSIGNAQSIANGSSVEAVISSVIVDSHGSISGNAWIAPVTADYMFNIKVTWGSNATSYRQMTLFKSTDGGATYPTTVGLDSAGANTNGQHVSHINRIVRLNAGDRVKVFLLQASGGSVSTVSDGNQNFMTVTKWNGGTQVAATATVAARYTTTSGQSIPNSTQTKIQFATKDFDNTNSFDSVTNHRFTFPISGIFRINCQVTFTGGTANTQRLAYIFKNGSEFSYGNVHTSTTGLVSVSAVTTTRMVAGDYVECFGLHSSGASLSLDTSAGRSFITVERVGL